MVKIQAMEELSGVFLFVKTDFPEIICLFEVGDLCLVVVY